MPRHAGSVISDQEAQLWSAYQADRSLANRNALVEFHLPLLRDVAAKMARHLVLANAAECASDGVAGLIRAIETFDPSRGVRFHTHATMRLRGAMLDAVRARDSVPRLVRWHTKRLMSTEHEWLRTHTKPPTDAQLARLLCISRETLDAWRLEGKRSRVAQRSLDTGYAHRNPPTRKGTTFVNAATLPDIAVSSPDASQSACEWWRTLLTGLSAMERASAILYWRYGWTMKCIGRHMGCSEGRVSQCLAETMRFLKTSRNMADFVDISSHGTSPKLLRLALPICHAIRLRHNCGRYAERTVHAH